MSSTRRQAWSPEGSPVHGQDRSTGKSRPVRRYRTNDLFGDCPCIVIEHGSAEYRLQVTRLGKLILTK